MNINEWLNKITCALKLRLFVVVLMFAKSPLCKLRYDEMEAMLFDKSHQTDEITVYQEKMMNSQGPLKMLDYFYWLII